MNKFFLFVVLVSSSVITACSQSPSNNGAANTTKPNTPQTTTTTATTQPVASAYASDKAGWLVDVEEAYQKSQKEKKPILANFTGSDWCGWCKKLDADVFSKPEFQSWAKDNVVLLELDFPRRKQIPQKNLQMNAGMQQALKVTGYPTVWLLDLTKNPSTGQFQVNGLGKTGYTPSADQFIATVASYMKK